MDSLRKTTETCRLIITRRNAAEILLLPTVSGWVLPRAEIRPHERLAEQLTEQTARAVGLAVYCLFVPRDQASGRPQEVLCAVAESVKQNDQSPAGTHWMPAASAAERCGSEDASAVGNALWEIESYAKHEKAGPFARPGWMRELFTWTNEQIAPLGLRLTGSFRQLNASPTFALVRLETASGAVWFKATGEPNTHELPVAVRLSRLFPRYVPRVLGVHQAWNGWLSAEIPGASLDETGDFGAWERAAVDLAELQIESTRKITELLEAGVKDLRIPVLELRIDPFIARMGEFMAAQEKTTPAPLARSELATLAEALKESCGLLRSLEIPDALGHFDFNPGNILACEDRCVFLDWAEGCVTSPFLTFEYLRQHMSRSGIKQPAAGERLAAAYLRPWMSFHSPENLRRALALSPLIAAFAYAVSTDSWRALDLVANPAPAAYYRSLARRMHREAVLVAQRSEPCLG